jgi:hypothetical protein
MTSRDEYVERFKKQLDEWNGSIDVLAAKASQAHDDVKAKVGVHVAELRRQHEAATERASEVRKASEDSWHELKGGVETAKNALHESFKKARAHFD